MRAIALAVLLLACRFDVLAQPALSVVGAEVRITTVHGARLRGELIAVDGDTLRLLYRYRLESLRMRDVLEVRAPRQGLSDQKVLRWSAIGAGLSSLGMFIACRSYEGGDGCGGVFPVVGVSWLLVGGISALAAGPGTRPVPVTQERLRPYARFPQGMPAGFSPAPGDREGTSTRDSGVPPPPR